MNCENIGCWRDWKGIVWDCVGEKIEPFTRFTLRCEVCRIVRNAASWSSILNDLLPYGTIWQKIHRTKCQVSCHYDRTLFFGHREETQ